MTIRDIKDFEDIIMNNACSSSRAVDIDFYMGTLASIAYKDFSEKDKEFINNTCRHLKDCVKCRNYYVDAKKDAASDTTFSEDYTPENFRLLRENEGVLDSLI